MKRQEYQVPTIRVVKIQHQAHLLAGSIVQNVQSGGLDDDDELGYGGGGDGWSR